MRIDDKNKVVWCSESEMDWYTGFNLSVGNTMIGDMKRIAHLSTDKEMVMRFNVDKNTRFKMISSIAEGYTFKLEQPKKYYWRKKKEHLAWFESESNAYLCGNSYSEPSDFRLFIGQVGPWRMEMSESEARDLLKGDFDKFEKVECE